MAVKVTIPDALKHGLKIQINELEGKSGTIINLINDLDKQYPTFAERTVHEGKIRRFINIYINEEDIRFIKNEETEVKDGDEVSIVAAAAGGNK
ncbi:sulfur carrier protein CysO [bacterium BMS3Abin15]|nr:sulfur carrier protein CysO [bacterium BMS3Abin15]HDH07474.1 MoaD/ThiS family protein [Candidatus Moranbacteria bacterium]HDZ85715.1 MoaD/ThiS family protein [Candidatus Moranbacteria bacterium]